MKAPARVRLGVAAVALIVVGGCASTGEAPAEAPDKARIVQELVVEASVRSVDRTTREVELLRADGSVVVLVAGPEVTNFDQIEVGDTVRSRYRETVTAMRLKPGEAAMEPTAAVSVEAAKPGQRPGMGVAEGVALTVTVESVDTSRHKVVVRTPEGDVRSVQATRDKGRRFIAGLAPGDRVTLYYTQGVALTVEE